MSDPKISIVMPVFNGEKYLGQAIRSVREQSFKDFELIVINDGSSDSTQSIIDSHVYEDSRVKAFTRENRGLVKSLNEGIDRASGDLIARMDADDICLPHRLQEQVDFLDRNTDISIVGGQAIVIDEMGKTAGILNKPVSTATIRNYLHYGCPIIHPTYMVRKNVYSALKGYREITAAEDLDFLLRADSYGFQMANLESTVLKYRINSAGMSARNARQQMRSTRLMLSNYHSSLQKNKKPGTAMYKTNSDLAEEDKWFKIVFNVRNSLLKGRRGEQRVFSKILAGTVSLLHFELALAAYRIWRCKRILNDL